MNMKWIKPCLIMIEIMVGIIALIMILAFSMDPTDTAMLTNSLLAILILVQLFIANIHLKMHEGRRR